MNDIKQLIEEEAERTSCFENINELDEYNTKTLRAVDIKTFNRGASFILSKWQEANRWRKVEEELPEQNESLLIENGDKTYKGRMEKLGTIKTKPVLVKYADGRVIIAHRCQCKGDNYFWWDCHESFDKDDFMYIVSWKPID